MEDSDGTHELLIDVVGTCPEGDVCDDAVAVAVVTINRV